MSKYTSNISYRLELSNALTTSTEVMEDLYRERSRETSPYNLEQLEILEGRLDGWREKVFLQLFQLGAVFAHEYIQKELNKGPTDWWHVMDWYNQLMDDDTACFYTRAMRQKDFNHPNVVKNPSDERRCHLQHMA